ncbi:MAG: PaaI family thioesterase [Desulfatiglans sp.]|jgi:acyl-coenzyme A thioesterase PaaI-like protein|nr:PaaI family thioesterase [Desulfatiglans sp.]
MKSKFFQDYYPENYSYCYGCGRLNEKGMHIKSEWDGDEGVCRYTPDKSKTGGFPEFLYGGIIASLIDCHCAGTAAAAKERQDGFEPGERPMHRFVTASLKVDYLKPTPVGEELEIRASVKEIKGRKITLTATLSASGTITAKGEAVMVMIPEEESKN